MTCAARCRNRLSSTAAWVASSCVALILCVPVRVQSDNRVALLPRLRAGLTLRYDIHARIHRQVKTESRVSTMMQTPDLNRALSIRLLLSVKDVRTENGKPVVVARVDLRNEEETANGSAAPATPKVEFKLSGDGQLASADGLDDLDAEQRLAWQFWIARFAYGWTLPPNGVKPEEKWKSEEVEKTPSPIANLVWERETTYVENNRCPVVPADSCASFLTQATLKQKSSPKDATPEEYRLHELKTSGTAEGTNEIITYISLSTGLVLRATEAVKQSMDVTILKADGTNGVHYTIEVTSQFETVFVSSKP
jgi:hypothetical protein